MSMTATARWLDGERFLTEADSGHALVADADHERNSGPSPVELVLMGLCGCTASDVVTILRKKRQAVRAVTVSAEAERAESPPRVFTRIHLVYRVAGQGVERKAAEDAVRLSRDKYCSVSRMLEASAAISHEIILVEAEATAHA